MVSLSSQLIPIAPLNIDFEQIERSARSGIFQTQIFLDHAILKLGQVKSTHLMIANKVDIYNLGMTNIKESIIEDINMIRTNIIHENNFPITLIINETQTLKDLFGDIEKACKSLKYELKKEDRENKRKRQTLERERNWKLSSLLRNEQERLLAYSEIMTPFLEKLKIEVADKNPIPNVYFAYAWPLEERKEELWVQNFLWNLQNQLTQAGIHNARLDIVSNRYGANIYEFMEQSKTDDYVLLFGTESLKDKHEKGFSAVCTELIHILDKRKKDTKQGLKRIFPILISGSLETSLPEQFRLYTTVRDWRREAYLKHFKSLYLALFRFFSQGHIQMIDMFWEDILGKSKSEQKIAFQEETNWYVKQKKIVDKIDNVKELTQIDVQIPQLNNKDFYISGLKEHYLTCNCKISILTIERTEELDRKFFVDSLYTNFTLIEKEQEKPLSRILEVDKCDSSKTIFQIKNEICPEDIFRQENLLKSKQKRVLVYGSPGIGKSTFISYVTYSWANEAKKPFWDEFRVILCINLRNLNENLFPNDRNYQPYEILQREYAIQLNFPKLLEDGELLNEALLILDGYDELPSEASKGHLASPLKRLTDYFPHILVTSRSDFVGLDCCCKFQIKEFNFEQVKEYVFKFFREAAESRDLEKSQRLIYYLSNNHLERYLPFTPINLTIICSLFDKNEELFINETPTTMTKLYDLIVNQFYKIFLIKKGIKGGDLNLPRAEQQPMIAPLVAVMEQLAFEATKRGSSHFDIEEILLIIEGGTRFLIKQIERLGFFKVEGQNVSFIHSTFQEFFATSYFAKLYIQNKRNMAKQIFKQYQLTTQTYNCNTHLENIFPMTVEYLSLLGANDKISEFEEDFEEGLKSLI